MKCPAPACLVPACLLIALPLSTGCSGDDDDGTVQEPDAMVIEEPDAMPLSQSCMDAADHSDILWIQENVFNSCAAFTVCHQGAALSAAGLNLESGFAEAAMIDTQSELFNDWDLVVPGDAENSYLMVILGDVNGPLKDGVGTMPYNNPLLCQPKLDAVSRWINALN